MKSCKLSARSKINQIPINPPKQYRNGTENFFKIYRSRIDIERLTGYLTKAIREAKEHTSWTTPDEAYERAVLGYAAAVVTHPRVLDALEAWSRANRT